MIDEKLARMKAYRNNIQRYRRLLKEQLSDTERDFIERRLCEEQADLQAVRRAAPRSGPGRSGEHPSRQS
jgi:hypothetical protein